MTELARHDADLEVLEHGRIEVVGRLREASNQTYAVRLVSELRTDEPLAVYKPIAGEAPLWDFPDGTLAAREVAAYLVSRATGWDVVPPTLLRDGPAGPGMLQIWIQVNDDEPVRVVRAGHEAGSLHVLDAEDQWGRAVSLVHEDTLPLRRIAVFDVLVNNTDRKGSHVLPVASGHRYGVDHGVCFHVEDKLRTVLWGWAGSPLRDDEVAVLRRVAADEDLHASLSDLLAEDEVRAFEARCARLIERGHLPTPARGWPSIPWPPL